MLSTTDKKPIVRTLNALLYLVEGAGWIFVVLGCLAVLVLAFFSGMIPLIGVGIAFLIAGVGALAFCVLPRFGRSLLRSGRARLAAWGQEDLLTRLAEQKGEANYQVTMAEYEMHQAIGGYPTADALPDWARPRYEEAKARRDHFTVVHATAQKEWITEFRKRRPEANRR